ncbi:MAG: hypothetical protein HYS57_00880 [Parcubacteria group bacterium]|nr:hypothetical protein [Parcubacteria group bacterium]
MPAQQIQEFIVNAIVKVSGVSSEGLTRLHAFLKREDINIPSEGYKAVWAGNQVARGGKWIRLHHVELQKNSDLYLVSAAFDIMVKAQKYECGGYDDLIPMPQHLLTGFFLALDPESIPTQETLTAANEAKMRESEEKKTIEEREEQLVDKIKEDMLGVKLSFDIFLPETMELIIPAHRTITATLIRKLVMHRLHLDWHCPTPAPSEEPIIKCLNWLRREDESTPPS